MTRAQLASGDGVDAKSGERFCHQRPVAHVRAADRDPVSRGQDRLEPSAPHAEGAADDRLPAAPQQVARHVGRPSRALTATQPGAEQLGIRAPGVVEHEQGAIQHDPILGQLLGHRAELRKGSQRIGHAGDLQSEGAPLAEGNRPRTRPPGLEEEAGIVERGVDIGRQHRPDPVGQASG